VTHTYTCEQCRNINQWCMNQQCRGVCAKICKACRKKNRNTTKKAANQTMAEKERENAS